MFLVYERFPFVHKQKENQYILNVFKHNTLLYKRYVLYFFMTPAGTPSHCLILLRIDHLFIVYKIVSTLMKDIDIWWHNRFVSPTTFSC